MWCVKLSDSQRDALRALVREQAKRGPALAAALEALDLARWDDLPGGHAALGARRPSWRRTQGIGEADVVWDLTARIPPEPEEAGAVSVPGAEARQPPA